MNRRETLKALFIASASTGIVATTGCSTNVNPNSRGKRVTWTTLDSTYSYGRTAVEKAHDQNLLQQSYFSEHELKGSRKFITIGTGFKTDRNLSIDLSYLISTSDVISPLENTIRLSLGFNFN